MHRLAHGHDQTTEEAYHAAALYLQGCLDAETAGSYTTEIFPEAKLGSETEAPMLWNGRKFLIL